jgi:hypothetical protein
MTASIEPTKRKKRTQYQIALLDYIVDTQPHTEAVAVALCDAELLVAKSAFSRKSGDKSVQYLEHFSLGPVIPVLTLSEQLKAEKIKEIAGELMESKGLDPISAIKKAVAKVKRAEGKTA